MTQNGGVSHLVVLTAILLLLYVSMCMLCHLVKSWIIILLKIFFDLTTSCTEEIDRCRRIKRKGNQKVQKNAK